MCNSFASARETTTTSLPAIVHLVIITPVFILCYQSNNVSVLNAEGRLLPATDEQQKIFLYNSPGST